MITIAWARRRLLGACCFLLVVVGPPSGLVDAADASASDALSTVVTEPVDTAAPATGEDGSSVALPLIVGLLVGIGIGAGGAMIVVRARSRGPAQDERSSGRSARSAPGPPPPPTAPAIDSGSATHRGSAPSALIDSVISTRDSVDSPALRDALARGLASVGVDEIRPSVGDPFDTELHEGTRRVATADAAADMTIAAVETPGYRSPAGRLRPARVHVFAYEAKT